MGDTTTIRIDRMTHEELKRLARERGATGPTRSPVRSASYARSRWARNSPATWVPTRRRGSILTSGDVVALDLGMPVGSKAGRTRPAVVITADRVLASGPNVIQVVPLTSTLGGYASEVDVAADDHNGLTVDSAAQCQHIRSVAVDRVDDRVGNVGAGVLAQIRDIVAVLLDL